MRDIISLNGLWEYKPDPEKKGMAEKWFEKVDFGDNTWSKCCLPAAIETLNPEKFLNFKGEIWFWRQVTISKEYEERFIELCLNRVLPKLEVFFEGKSLGIHEKGDVPISFRVPKGIGTEKALNLMVRVFGLEDTAPQYTIRWFGILDDVFLKVTGALKFDFSRIQAYPKDNYTKAHIDCHFDVTSMFTTDVYAQIAVRLCANGKEVFAKLENFKSLNQTTSHVIVSFELDTVHLWSLEDPFLYDLDVRVNRTNQIQDNFITHLGIRELIFKDQILHINGKPIILKGTSYFLHAPGSGPIIPPALIQHDLTQIKKLGLNTLYLKDTASETLLFYADFIGLIVIEYASQDTLITIVKRQGYHPSMLGWVIEPNVKLDALTQEYGSNLLFFRLNHTLKEVDLSPQFFMVQNIAQLEDIQPRKQPQIVAIEIPAIAGKSTMGYNITVPDSEDFQRYVFNLLIKLIKGDKPAVSGIIFGEWIDESSNSGFQRPNLGINTADRRHKQSAYMLHYELK